jgi:hypothetical protein
VNREIELSGALANIRGHIAEKSRQFDVIIAGLPHRFHLSGILIPAIFAPSLPTNVKNCTPGNAFFLAPFAATQRIKGEPLVYLVAVWSRSFSFSAQKYSKISVSA